MSFKLYVELVSSLSSTKLVGSCPINSTLVTYNREVFSTCVSILLLKDLYFLQTKLGDFLEYIEQEERQNL